MSIETTPKNRSKLVDYYPKGAESFNLRVTNDFVHLTAIKVLNQKYNLGLEFESRFDPTQVRVKGKNDITIRTSVILASHEIVKLMETGIRRDEATTVFFINRALTRLDRKYLEGFVPRWY